MKAVRRKAAATRGAARAPMLRQFCTNIVLAQSSEEIRDQKVAPYFFIFLVKANLCCHTNTNERTKKQTSNLGLSCCDIQSVISPNRIFPEGLYSRFTTVALLGHCLEIPVKGRGCQHGLVSRVLVPFKPSAAACGNFVAEMWMALWAKHTLRSTPLGCPSPRLVAPRRRCSSQPLAARRRCYEEGHSFGKLRLLWFVVLVTVVFATFVYHAKQYCYMLLSPCVFP